MQTDAANGVAIVGGQNFFPGTTVRFGNKTYVSGADGLIIKSDQELEVALPEIAASWGGEISSRYGRETPLRANTDGLPGYRIEGISAAPFGNFLYSRVAGLSAGLPIAGDDPKVNLRRVHPRSFQ